MCVCVCVCVIGGSVIFFFFFFFNVCKTTATTQNSSFQLTCRTPNNFHLPTPSPPNPPHPTPPDPILPCSFLCFRNGDFLNLTLDKFETFPRFTNQKQCRLYWRPRDFQQTNRHGQRQQEDSGSGQPPGSADHLTEMMMPVDTWGKSFLTSSTPDRSLGDVFRILSSEDNTTVLLNGTARFISKAGTFW